MKTEENCTKLTLSPVELTFNDGLTIKIQTSYDFIENGKTEITREIISSSDPNAVIEFEEYVKGCYGFTEYPEKLKGIEKKFSAKSLSYELPFLFSWKHFIKYLLHLM